MTSRPAIPSPGSHVRDRAPIVVVALGGNALLQRGERPDAAPQQERVKAAAQALAPLTVSHRLVVCHGNGPQIGLAAVESATDRSLSAPYPLDLLGAQTQGLIGHMLTLELSNATGRPTAGVLTSTVVDKNDPAFQHPSKPIGVIYDKNEAFAAMSRNGWSVAPDPPGWRRVVPSPAPVDIADQHAVEVLLAAGFTVVCGGGGGVPVVEDHGTRAGVEAVVDKDRLAALLAIRLQAEQFVILTDVDGVQAGRDTQHPTTVRHATPADLTALALDPGSMGAKAEAAGWFATVTGRTATIGSLSRVTAVLEGTSGTRITATRATIEDTAAHLSDHLECPS